MRQSKACRLCTKSTINRNLKTLFESNHKLVTQIKEITGILLKNVQSLPQHICKVCREDLQKAHEFRVRCINSQEYFNSLDFTGAKDEPSEGFEIKNNMPTINAFCAPEISFTPVNETKDELLIDEKIIAESCSLKTESKDVLADDELLFDIDDSRSNSCNHSKYSADIQNDAATILDASSNVKIDTTKLNVTLAPQRKKLQRAQIIQQRQQKKSEKVIFVCDQCGMSFPYRSHFLAHQRRHNGEKVFHCEICPEKFFENWQLKVHLRKHKGEKPFACEFCGVRFLQNNDRKLHVRRRHTNERPYICSQCSKAFAVSGMLKRHMLTHTGEKSFR